MNIPTTSDNIQIMIGIPNFYQHPLATFAPSKFFEFDENPRDSPGGDVGVDGELSDEQRQVSVGHDLRFVVSDQIGHFRFALNADHVVAMFDGLNDDGGVVELTLDDAIAIVLAGIVVDDVDGVVADVTLLVHELCVVIAVRHQSRHVETYLKLSFEERGKGIIV